MDVGDDEQSSQYAANISIPVGLITKQDGDAFETALTAGSSVLAVLDWTDVLPHPDERVGGSFGPTPGTSAGRSATSRRRSSRTFGPSRRSSSRTATPRSRRTTSPGSARPTSSRIPRASRSASTTAGTAARSRRRLPDGVQRPRRRHREPPNPLRVRPGERDGSELEVVGLRG